jgi:hypothetical protein
LAFRAIEPDGLVAHRLAPPRPAFELVVDDHRPGSGEPMRAPRPFTDLEFLAACLAGHETTIRQFFDVSMI